MKKGLLLLFLAIAVIACQKDEMPAEGNDLLLLKSAPIGFEPVCDATSYTLFAGQTTDVGYLEVSNDADYLKVEYVVTAGNLTEVQLWVGTDANKVPKAKGNGAPVPGQFPWKLKEAGEYVFYIPLSSLIAGCDQNLYIYAHAVVDDQTAWSEGTSFGSSRWGWYSTYKVCCDDRKEDGDEVVCNEETGFAGSTAGKGSAWWFAFDTQGAATQPIYAGQKLTDATVTFADGKFTIDLGSWSLQDGNETVKSQGYNTLPNKRPAAGQFTMYKGADLEFNGNGSRYYVIHLDMMLCEDVEP